MSSDFEAYEQDFGTITAEITNKIGRIPKLSGGKTVYCMYVLAEATLLPWSWVSHKVSWNLQLRGLHNGGMVSPAPRCNIQFIIRYIGSLLL